jgi:ATP-dependent DNA helicase RecG
VTAPASELFRLRKVLERELDEGCRDRIVIGGLDRLFIQAAEDGHLDSLPRLQALLGRLPAGGYRELPPAARRSWLGSAIQSVPPPPRPAQPPAAPARRAHSVAPLEPGDPITRLPGLRAGLASRFEKLGIRTLADAATLYPRRFNDFTNVRQIAELTASIEPQTVIGTVASRKVQRFGRRFGGTEAVLRDASGSLRVVWFNMPFIAKSLSEGQRVVVSGRIRHYRGRLQMDNPELEDFDESMAAGRLVPVYPATQGLGQRTIRKAVELAVRAVASKLIDPLPAHVRDSERMDALEAALRTYHAPKSAIEAERVRKQLALREFLAIQAAVLMRRAEWQDGAAAPNLEFRDGIKDFVGSLPFRLTGSQQDALDDLLHDLRGPRPMLRLLQGDVGSGKTVIAIAAMLAAVRNGYQAALMAPTEILAEQHFRTLSAVLGGEGALEGVFAPPWFARPLRVLLLTGSLSAAQKRSVRGDTANQGADIVIGTHALIEDGVEFPRLGLAVVDEQHRFGVMQRAKLRQKGANPHLLVMTATPIPRTLALTVYGDLEVTTIDELPPGRKPIETSWVTPIEREFAYANVRARLSRGEQAFVICPLVEDSDALDARSAEEEFLRLSGGPFAGFRLALLHGRMAGKDKDTIMKSFAAREIDMLVSTSVIEVGIDVPNATTMIIEGAERFGLSQLHQFRGRVGRSDMQSYCLLFSTDEEPGPDATTRLKAMERSNDGFELAEVDLELRGEGEVWGRVQAGANSMLRVARLTDRDLLYRARAIATDILSSDPKLESREHAQLRAAAAPFLDRATEAN